jgi:hypothetical protein
MNAMRTHAPARSFSIARSTAGWYIPLPRNVSMTCPFRKKAEKTLVVYTYTSMIFERGAVGRGRHRKAYGFVNMMSDAPSVQRVRCECRYVRAGRIPHVSGSSSL